MLKKECKKTLFTTPSHNGKVCILHKFYQWYRSDVSETDAYNPQAELTASQERASKLYGTKSTHYLTNGSSSGIIAAILSSCAINDKILIWNKSHKCHKNGAKLAGAKIIEYELNLNNEWGVYEPLSAQKAEELIKQHQPKAMVITSPSYEGICTDIKAISDICKKNNVILIADEAHGALYPFSDKLPVSAVKYADFTVQSLHKTAGGLNPTALLHCNCDISPNKVLDMITTTSPSYPLLASIETNINYLFSKRGQKEVDNLINNILYIKSKLTNLEFFGDDITKILIKKNGLSGYELSEILYENYNIEDEITNEKSTMLLTGIGTTKRKLDRLLKIKNI